MALPQMRMRGLLSSCATVCLLLAASSWPLAHAVGMKHTRVASSILDEGDAVSSNGEMDVAAWRQGMALLQTQMQTMSKAELQTQGQGIVEKIVLPTSQMTISYDANTNNIYAMHWKDGSQVAYKYIQTVKPSRVVLYFHGNAEDADDGPLSALSDTFDADVIGMDFPGYGQSTGSAEEHEIDKAMLSFCNYVVSVVGAENVVFVGRSIGTGIATKTAVNLAKAGKEIQALMLVSPYTRCDKLVRHFASVAISWMVSSTWWNTVDIIGQLNIPVLVVHGKSDNIVPYSMGQDVCKAARSCTLETINEGHNDVWGVYSASYTTSWVYNHLPNHGPLSKSWSDYTSKCKTVKKKGTKNNSSVLSYIGALSMSSCNSFK